MPLHNLWGTISLEQYSVSFADLAYLEYERILNVDWDMFSQIGITCVMNAITHVGSEMLSNVGIPLVCSVSAGFVLGIARG